tara:strand:- start:763 stop:1095 length:333 start_codon:yes stop_codon:yes gene_type:complete
MLTPRIDNFPRIDPSRGDVAIPRHSGTAEFARNILLQAAKAGERCPTRDEMSSKLMNAGYPASKNIVSTLAKLHQIRIETYGKNFRVVEVEGLRTAEPTYKHAKPHRILE